MSSEFDPKKFFIKARREYIEEPLKQFGFKKYKTSSIARLTDGNVFQFLNFQKSAYGGQRFTVNVAIRPLFSGNEFLTLMPGNRLGMIATKSKTDKWWNYSTEEDGIENFKDVFEMIGRYALPFFEATQNSNDIITSFERNLFGVRKFGKSIEWGTIGWEDFDLGHIYLHAKRTKKAIQHFNACYKEFSNDDRDWAQEAAKDCLNIKNIIASGQDQINTYLADTINNSRRDLKLTDW